MSTQQSLKRKNGNMNFYNKKLPQEHFDIKEKIYEINSGTNKNSLSQLAPYGHMQTESERLEAAERDFQADSPTFDLYLKKVVEYQNKAVCEFGCGLLITGSEDKSIKIFQLVGS